VCSSDLRTPTHTHTHTQTHADTHTHRRTQTHTHTHRHLHTHTHTHTDARRHTHTHTQTHADTHTHTDTYTHTHTQTHAHTHTDARRHTHTHRHLHRRTQTHTHTDARRHTHTHTQTHADTHTHAHTQPHTNTHTAAHSRTQTHARTRTHTHTQPVGLLWTSDQAVQRPLPTQHTTNTTGEHSCLQLDSKPFCYNLLATWDSTNVIILLQYMLQYLRDFTRNSILSCCWGFVQNAQWWAILTERCSVGRKLKVVLNGVLCNYIIDWHNGMNTIKLMCRLMVTESGLRLRTLANGYVEWIEIVVVV
jgi:hypothetical protein